MSEASKRRRNQQRRYRQQADVPSWIRQLGRCGDCGKIRYATRADARAEARRQVSMGLPKMRAYPCGNYFHLTSLTGEDAALERARVYRMSTRSQLATPE